MNYLLNMLLGQIPEAIYFSLFMIYTKQLKEKRLLYIVLMIIEYILLIQIFPFNVWFQILYTFISFLILKLLYKEKSQVIDIFTFSIASIVLIFTSAVMYLISHNTYHNTYISSLLHKIILFIFLFVFKNKLYNIQKLYKKIWNRNFNKTYKIKTTTFRALNVVAFNIMFFIINFGMLLVILFKSGGA